MNWKMFPPTQTSVLNQELSQKTRVSLETLFHNLDALLKRDKTDCLAKQLDGLLRNNSRIYQVKPRFQRIQHKFEKFVCVREIEKTVKKNAVEENYYRHSSLGAGIKKTLVLQPKTNHSHTNEPTTRVDRKDLFFTKDSATSPQLSPKLSTGKEEINTTRLQLTSDGKDCKEDVFPSNGWWRKQDHCDSETETNASLNLEEKSDDPRQYFLGCAQIYLSSSDFSEKCHNLAKIHERVSSFPSRIPNAHGEQFQEQNGTKESCNFFQLTTVEKCLVPSPPQTTRVPDDATYLTRSENKPLLMLSETLSRSNEVTFDNHLRLDYGELIQQRRYTTSRTSYNKLEIPWYNSLAPNEGYLIEECNNYKRSLEDRNKVLCVLPSMKVNKIKPVGLAGKTADVKRCPKTVNVPVKLRLHHRSKCSAKFYGEVEKDSGTDERVLPTTLNKTADVSYSLMSPYMANVVWSVMDDEKVL